MEFFKKYKQQVAVRLTLLGLLPVIVTAGAWYAGAEFLDLTDTIAMIVGVSSGTASAIILASILSNAIVSPLHKMEEVVGYAAHSNRSAGPPDIESLKIGRELVTAQSLAIYDMASDMPSAAQQPNQTTQKNAAQTPVKTSTQTPQPTNTSLLDNIAVPLFGTDANQIVTIANKSAAAYVNKPLDQIIGQPLVDSLKLSFQGDATFESWLSETKQNAVTATKSWDRVRHYIDEDNHKQFDMVASFSSGNSSGTDTMIALFDHTERYNQDDQEISFVALAVHELRTPLTIMRGYIEVFEDELGPNLNPEMIDFMHKMKASAQQLTAFVGNILNVARVEENQLALKLRKDNIAGILQTAINDLELRAQVHGKHIELNIAEGLPEVAVDPISIHEVINNLVDNAIKYSNDSDKIIVSANINDQNQVQVDVQDFGIGIPSSVMGELFQKFHRSHRSKTQVSGTGLGLYLSKALITAHGGNIWVRSKEGEGSLFSFTVVPYDQMSEEQLAGEDGIIRGAHGWIKNHSLYRN